jgi:sec-independent protein translocase protein TatB
VSFAGVGPAEVLLVLIVALLVFGPQRLPQIAKDLGKTIGKWRKALDEIQTVTDMPAEKLIDLAAKEEEMQESVQRVVPGGDDGKAESGEQSVPEGDNVEETKSTQQIVGEEDKVEEPKNTEQTVPEENEVEETEIEN